jgi:hypothetical protein
MTSPEPHDENDGRVSARKTILRKGTIVYNHRMSTMECVIFDLSDTGARFKPVEVGMLPDAFELRVLFGEIYQCQMVHQIGDEVGVRFA